MEHIFLLNPAAGRPDAIRRLVPRIRAASARTGIPYTLYETKAPGDAERLVRRCADTGKPYRFYACGGDGTLNDAARGALHRDNIELAAVPCGTGNDFVRNLGGASRFLDLDAQMRGHAVPLDVITSSDGNIAVNIVNIGFDCNVADGAQYMKQLAFVSGSLAYWLSLCDELTRPLGQSMAISTDDGQMQMGQFLLCAIGNGGYCGAGFRALPDADLTDGLLNLSTVRVLPRREMLSLLARYRDGSYLSHPLAEQYVRTQTCRRVTIRMPRPMRVSFDGEITRTDALRLQVDPAAIQFCIPE